jgi:hypothetical protein
VRYELEQSIPEDGILHSHRQENRKSYIISLFKLVLERKPKKKYETLRNCHGRFVGQVIKQFTAEGICAGNCGL